MGLEESETSQTEETLLITWLIRGCHQRQSG